MGYNLLLNGVYWGYNPLTNHLLTAWDIEISQYLQGFIHPRWLLGLSSINSCQNFVGSKMKKSWKVVEDPVHVYTVTVQGGGDRGVYVGCGDVPSDF